MKISLTLTIERGRRPAETAEVAPGAVVGTFREAKADQPRAKAAGRGTVGFAQVAEQERFLRHGLAHPNGPGPMGDR